MPWPALSDPDEDGVALLKSGPSAYEIGPKGKGVIIIGAHEGCPEDDDERGVIVMANLDDLFDMSAKCASCGKTFTFQVIDSDLKTDFVAWGISMMNRPHKKQS